MAKDKDRKREHLSAEKPISLKPLEFDEAVSNLLKVKPEPKKDRVDNNEDKP